MDIIIKGRRTSIPERFRQHAAGKLAKIEKLDQKAMRIDVEVTKERNPRQSTRRERVELTIHSRGPVIRAEAAADDRYTALDLAFAKLESRLRRACDRRKARHGDRDLARSGAVTAGAPGTATVNRPAPGEPAVNGLSGDPSLPDMPPAPSLPDLFDLPGTSGVNGVSVSVGDRGEIDGDESASARLVPIQMEGDGPLVVREKLHAAAPMTIDQALLEMELVGHDFYLFHDRECDLFSVVYRRCGYDYGVIRLMERPA